MTGETMLEMMLMKTRQAEGAKGYSVERDNMDGATEEEAVERDEEAGSDD